MKRKFTEEKSRRFERNLSKAIDLLEGTKKSKRLQITKLFDIMDS